MWQQGSTVSEKPKELPPRSSIVMKSKCPTADGVSQLHRTLIFFFYIFSTLEIIGFIGN